jgi:UrcA family protein
MGYVSSQERHVFRIDGLSTVTREIKVCASQSFKRIVDMRVAHPFAALLVAVTMAGASLATRADEQVDAAPSKTVTHADLDLTAPEGIKTLYRRIQGAARAVCRPPDPFYYSAGRRAQAECYRLTVAHTVAGIDRPLLTRVHDSETATD